MELYFENLDPDKLFKILNSNNTKVDDKVLDLKTSILEDVKDLKTTLVENISDDKVDIKVLDVKVDDKDSDNTKVDDKDPDSISDSDSSIDENITILDNTFKSVSDILKELLAQNEQMIIGFNTFKLQMRKELSDLNNKINRCNNLINNLMNKK